MTLLKKHDVSELISPYLLSCSCPCLVICLSCGEARAVDVGPRSAFVPKLKLVALAGWSGKTYFHPFTFHQSMRANQRPRVVIRETAS